MRILLFGRTGLIGHAIAQTATENGFEVLGFGRRTSPSLDLGSPDQIDTLPLQGVDAVVHAAGVTDEEIADDPRCALLRSSLAAAHLMDRCTQAGIKRFLYISSSHVYGPFEEPVSEASPVNPLSEYALCHFATEQTIRRSLRSRGGSGLFVRPNAVYGMPPDLSRFQRWSLIPFQFPQSLVQTRSIRIRSKGDQMRNFVSAQDIADGCIAWLSQEAGEQVSVWNPVGPVTCTVFQFAELCVTSFQEVSGKFGIIERGQDSTPGANFRLESEWTLTKPIRRPEGFLDEITAWLLDQT